MIVAVIPARYAATRLPGKPLIDLEGRSMIEHVWLAAHGSRIVDEVIVATDDKRIVAEVERFGGSAQLTDPQLPSGTDRCYAAVEARGLQPDVVINVQGDEPLLTSSVIDSLVESLLASSADIATPVMKLTDNQDLDDPAVVKVVRKLDGTALYFSRSAIPFNRSADRAEWASKHVYWKHAGIYAYRFAALKEHVSLPPSQLEIAESLEQLRLLEHGAQFLCVESDATLISVDTPSDAERVRSYLRMSKGR